MKRSKCAIYASGLLAMCSAPVHAEVTVYGAIKPTIESIKAEPGIKKKTDMTDSGSFLGFRGTEDLGGGLSVYFVLQQLYDVSGSGGARAVNTNGFSDMSYVGVKGNFGSVQVGYMPLHNPTGLLQWDGGAATMGLATLVLPMVHSNGQTFGSTAGGRMSNMVLYTSPSFNGVQVAAFGGRPDDTTVLAGATAKAYGVTLTYANGPWFALYSHITQDNNSLIAVKGFNVKGDRLTGAYHSPLGWNVAVVLDRNRNDDPLIGNNLRRTTVGMPVWYTMGAHTFAATYARAGDVSSIANSGAKFTMAGYSYALSKRTRIYADVARIANEANAHYDFQVQASVGGIGGPPNFAFRVPGGSDPTAVQIGISHSF